MNGVGVLAAAIPVAQALLVAAFLLAFVRLARGPTLPDRVVALDLMASLTVSFIAVTAVGARRGALLDVAIVLALISFLGTTAFARYLERRAAGE